MSDLNNNSNLLSNLNSKQQSACWDIDGPSLVIAGAGSGKTRVLTYRIAYMLENFQTDPSSILAITFTNKAAKEMKDRLNKLIGDEAKYLTATTFHSFGALILRREIGYLGRKVSFNIIDDDDTESMVKECMKDLNLDPKFLKPKTVINYISMIKSRQITLNEIDDFRRFDVENVMNKYQAKLLDGNLVDFDDLLLLPLTIFENNPDVLNKYQDIYRYILVDEFQDTSNIQYDFVRLLGSKYRNVFIVGDEDQSIYSFRGANIKNIRKFMKDFSEYQQYVLDQNYRSRKPILDAANKLISKNKTRIPKDLWSTREGDNPVIFRKFHTDKDEAREIIDEIKRLTSIGYKYSDICILYRNNYLSRNFENELILNRLPYQVYSGLSFYKRKEVKDILAYMRLSINPNDMFSFSRVVNSPKRGIGDTSVKKIEEALKNTDGSLLHAIMAADINGPTKRKCVEFMDLISDLRDSLNTQTLDKYFEDVYKKTGYEEYIESLDDEEKKTRKQNINELLSAITENGEEDTPLETIKSFLDNVVLYTDADLESRDPNHVSLMTMHTAKGLEFKVIFAVALEEQIIPGQNNFQTTIELEEERRVMYVCMTRAMDILYLTCVGSRYQYGMTISSIPSRFIKDAGISEYIPPRPQTRIVNQSSVGSSLITQTERKMEKKGEFNTGDRVVHSSLGKGTVAGEIQGFYIIRFDDIATPKKIMVGHPLLKKLK